MVQKYKIIVDGAFRFVILLKIFKCVCQFFIQKIFCYYCSRSYLFHFVFLERKSSRTFDVNRNHNHIKQTPLELFKFVFVFILGYLATSNP